MEQHKKGEVTEKKFAPADDSTLYVEGISSKFIYEGPIIRVSRDEVRLPNGVLHHWDVVRHRGAVCVIPICDNGDVILVRQYRYPVGKVLLEIPAGKLEGKDSDRDAAVRRELREETGATAKSIVRLGEFYGTPAYVDERITVYLATGLEFGEQELDRDEFLSVVRMPLLKAVEMVLSGEIEDAKTQAGLLRVYVMRMRSADKA